MMTDGSKDAATEPGFRPIRVVILDTVTGERAAVGDFGSWWWSEGNGCCDCNRSLLAFPEAELSDAQADADDAGTCLGEERFLIVEAEPRDGCTLRELNEHYPKGLVERFLGPG